MKPPQFIPDRLNEQPAVLRGCSWPEINSIIKFSFTVSFIISLVFSFIFSNYSLILAVTPIFMAIFFMVLTKRTARLKNGRPLGYFTLKAKLRKQRSTFSSKKFFIEHDGFWKISKD